MKKKKLLLLVGIIGMICLIKLLFQNMNSVEARNEAGIEIINNEYGKVYVYQTDDKLLIETSVHKNDMGRRFLLRLIDQESKQLIHPITSEDYEEYRDNKNINWLTTAKFLKEESKQELTFDWQNEYQAIEIEAQMVQQMKGKERDEFLTPIEKKLVKRRASGETTEKNSDKRLQPMTEKTISTSETHTINSVEEQEQQPAQSQNKEVQNNSAQENSVSIRPFEFPKLVPFVNKEQKTATIVPTYLRDENGVYPEASWIPHQNETVLNHQGNHQGSNQWDGMTSWDGDPNNRLNSYIEHGGSGDEATYAIRKYAKETSTPGLYDVFLNIRGNVQKKSSPLDVVLVVDWSGSMNEENRLTEVRRGVNRFVDTLEHSGVTDQINLGYIGYSSDGYLNASVPLNSFTSVKEKIKEVTPIRTQGGTFTQKALRDAGEMLGNPNNHEKVIVLLTDGVPTFSYHVNKVFTEKNGEYYGTEFNYFQDGLGNTSALKDQSYEAFDQNNQRKKIQSTFTATIGEALALKKRGIEIHGLGIQLQADESAGLTKEAVEANMKKMVSEDEAGKFYYESANDASDISDYLAKKAIHIAGTISNGKVMVPITQPFKYEENSLAIKSVGKNELAVKPTVEINGATIQSNQLYLGKDQEIQMQYQVRIQTESKDFKPDYWYQLNEKTTLYPTGDPQVNVEFGIPSVKAPSTTLAFTKEWEEYDHNTSSRPDYVTYEIKRTPVIDAHSWQTGFIRLNKPANDTEPTWKRTNIQKLSASKKENYQEALVLPKYNNQGQIFDYQAINETAVSGYDSIKVNKTTWKNTKTFIPLELKITKNSSTGEKNLAGAIFELTGQSIHTRLVDNRDGSYQLPADIRLEKGEVYTLTEIQAPTGHELSQQNVWTIKISAKGAVSVNEQAIKANKHVISLTIENPFKPVPLAIRKYTIHESKEINLANATFELQKKDESSNYQTLATEVTSASGRALFSVKMPGNYRMVETKGPIGYDTIAGNYEFMVDKYGNILYEGENIETQPQWTLTHQNNLKLFDLTVHKKKEEGLPLKGAAFKIEGENISSELPKEGIHTDTFVFKNLQPGTYTLTETKIPEGYQGLKQPVIILIAEDGTVTVDNVKQENVLVTGEGNNQINIDITNQAKIPLPETGGSGRNWFYFIGLMGGSSAFFMAVLKKQRKNTAK